MEIHEIRSWSFWVFSTVKWNQNLEQRENNVKIAKISKYQNNVKITNISVSWHRSLIALM
jgi:hypothetical protein